MHVPPHIRIKRIAVEKGKVRFYGPQSGFGIIERIEGGYLYFHKLKNSGLKARDSSQLMKVLYINFLDLPLILGGLRKIAVQYGM